jgi:hypothetical protein
MKPGIFVFLNSLAYFVVVSQKEERSKSGNLKSDAFSDGCKIKVSVFPFAHSLTTCHVFLSL